MRYGYGLVVLALFGFCMDVSASDRRGRRRYVPQNQQVQKTPTETKSPSAIETCEDALAEVNAERAKLGLKPFINDSLLNKAALACAKQRATRGIHGHLPESDFSYLSSGGNAASAGCGALEDSWGWGTCCYKDDYTYAGAAWVRGADGLRYMHIFVR